MKKEYMEIVMEGSLYLLWFKFYLCLNFFKLHVDTCKFGFYFSLSCSHYHYISETKENQNQTGLKKMKQRKNLNHNIFMINTFIEYIFVQLFCIFLYTVSSITKFKSLVLSMHMSQKKHLWSCT